MGPAPLGLGGPWAQLCLLIVPQIQPVSDEVVAFLWAGQTWSFRAALDAAEIRGAYYEASTEGDNPAAGRQYYRTIQVDLSGENSKKIKDIITEIFHNLSMRVKVRSTPEEGSSVAEVVAELRQLDCLFFDARTSARSQAAR